MLSVLLTIVWLGSPNEVVELYTTDMEYCKGLAQQVVIGDGADYAYCKYVSMKEKEDE